MQKLKRQLQTADDGNPAYMSWSVADMEDSGILKEFELRTNYK